MIENIIMKDIASFKNDTILETGKKFNFIYGLNGTGKSTISNYLYDMTNEAYKNCSIKSLDNNLEFLVYNTRFIEDNFYESESLKGIFSLSKENKEAKLKINQVNEEIERVQELIIQTDSEKQQLKDNSTNDKKYLVEKLWEVKKKYSSPNKLDYCLSGLKTKDKLFEHLIALPNENEFTDMEEITKTIASLSDYNNKKFEKLKIINFDIIDLEKNPILLKQIVGNENSSVSSLINHLNNSDWVKAGRQYIESSSHPSVCPFCQQKTVTEDFINSIETFFDASYEKDLVEINKLYNNYKLNLENDFEIINLDEFPVNTDLKLKYSKKYMQCLNTFKNNLKIIKSKYNTPNLSVELLKSESLLVELNNYILAINEELEKYNTLIENKEKTLNDMKIEFWKNMRNQYAFDIDSFTKKRNEANSNIRSKEKFKTELILKLRQQKEVLIEEQKKTINIDDAISNINQGLIDIGIENFKIEKHTNDLYHIIRSSQYENVFSTLSEGEKMIISFLYFIELCKGKKFISEQSNKKIVVIDDPISSLSHIYVYNIGQLIQKEFLRSNSFEQVFILTHSLYFFYEMVERNEEKRKENQKLFRLSKNHTGSGIITMKYEEIQNDYHAYWRIIKDRDQFPALIANCMRNIIEYFFNFVEKKSLNNVFQKSELQNIKFAAFNRYINRESHSLGQNIFDIKEFDYDSFSEAFKLVFKLTGYEDHYIKMMR